MVRKEIGSRIVKHMMESKTEKFLDILRYGYNNYGFIFYIGSISAILGGVFGNAGWLSIIVTIFFLYYAGKFKMIANTKKEERAARHKRQNTE